MPIDHQLGRKISESNVIVVGWKLNVAFDVILRHPPNLKDIGWGGYLDISRSLNLSRNQVDESANSLLPTDAPTLTSASSLPEGADALRSLFYRRLLSSFKIITPQAKCAPSPSHSNSGMKSIETITDGVEKEKDEDGVMCLISDVGHDSRHIRRFHSISKEKAIYSQLSHLSRVFSFRHSCLLDFNNSKFWSPLSQQDIFRVFKAIVMFYNLTLMPI
jgi:hypothetical protein